MELYVRLVLRLGWFGGFWVLHWPLARSCFACFLGLVSFGSFGKLFASYLVDLTSAGTTTEKKMVLLAN